mgnify:CR=1 FL=1
MWNSSGGGLGLNSEHSVAASSTTSEGGVYSPTSTNAGVPNTFTPWTFNQVRVATCSVASLLRVCEFAHAVVKEQNTFL